MRGHSASAVVEPFEFNPTSQAQTEDCKIDGNKIASLEILS